MEIKIILTLPDGCTLGDLAQTAGVVFGASTGFVDWEKLYSGESGAISTAGIILLDLARQLEPEALSMNKNRRDK